MKVAFRTLAEVLFRYLPRKTEKIAGTLNEDGRVARLEAACLVTAYSNSARIPTTLRRAVFFLAHPYEHQ